MSVTENFNRHFRALEAALDIEGELTDSPSKNFEKLYKMSAERVFAGHLTDYAMSRLGYLRSSTSRLHNQPIENMDIRHLVADLIFHQLVHGVAHRYSKSAPKVHHWLPVSYTRHFTPGPLPKKGERLRRCEVQTLSFIAAGSAIAGSVNDRHFAHGVDEDGNGFYHLSMEYFFCKIESGAAEARDKISDKRSGGNEGFLYAALASFFIVQSVRNPHPDSKQFSIRTIAGVIEALIEALDMVPEVFVSAPKVQFRMAFTPYVPARVRKLTDGVRVLVFPLATSQAFTISDAPIARRKARTIALDSNVAVIKHARRTGSMIFGVTHKDIFNMTAMRD
jgi:hypothetical protein